MAGHSTAALLLRLFCGLGCFALAAGLRVVEASSAGGSAEPLHARVLRVATTAAVGLLIAQLVLTKPLILGAVADGTDGKVNDDPNLTWRENEGVSELTHLCPALEQRTKAGKQGVLPMYTLAEVAKHSSVDDLWVVIDGLAYDLTTFVARHPGGVRPLRCMAGKDCTDVFANYHAARVYRQLLPQCLVGEVTGIEVYPHVADFRKIRQELLRRGLFQTDYRFYAQHACWLATLLCGALYLSLGCASCTAHMVGAAVMGIFWQQLAGIGHDLGHSGVTHNFHKDHKIGSLLAFLMGCTIRFLTTSHDLPSWFLPLTLLIVVMLFLCVTASSLSRPNSNGRLSVCWWKSDHNTHHIVCNAIEHDPNIQHMPLLAVTPQIFRRPKFWDTYHQKWVGMDDLARFLVSYQHLFFYPVMILARLNLYIQGLFFLLTRPDMIHYRNLELGSIVGFLLWCSAVVASMPTWGEAAGWVLISHGVAGILHVQIVLSHWAMWCYEGRAYTGKDDEWYITQLRTTMNVATHPWLDWVHLGLQFQIEHHLYPRLPRHNLRVAREMVLAVCKKHNIRYHEPGFFEVRAPAPHLAPSRAIPPSRPPSPRLTSTSR